MTVPTEFNDMSRPLLPRSWPGSVRLVSALLVFLVVGSSLVATPVLAAEDPRFEASVSEPELTPGAQQTLVVSLTNDAEDVDDQVSTASNLRVTATSGSTPIDVQSGERRIESLADGQSATLEFTVEVPRDVPGGTYTLPLEVIYEYDGDERERTTVRATVEVPERPIFAVETERVDLHPRETGAVTVALRNVGSEPANDTTATLTAPGQGLSVGEAGERAFLGTLGPGEERSVTVPVTSTKTASSIEHELSVEPTYENTNGIREVAPARSVSVTVAEDPRIGLTGATGYVPAGERGTVEWTLQNRGESVMSAVTLSLESADPAVTFRGTSTTTRFFEQWAPGETKTVRTELAVGESARDGTTPLTGTVTFDHAAGFQADGGPYSFGAPSSAVDGISFTDLELTHGGPHPVLLGSVTNDGTEPLENAVAVIRAETAGVMVREGRTSLGTLDPGETKAVTAAVSTGGSDRRQLTFEGVVQYDRGGNQAATEPTAFHVTRSPEESLFAVQPVNATFEVDKSNALRVRIENDGPVTLTDVRAQLTARPPYESQSPSAYVSTIEPGESTIVAFEVTTPDDGVRTADTLEMNLTADTPSGQSVSDGPHLVPFVVGDGDTTSGSLIIVALAVVVILVMAGGWWWLNR